MADPQTPIERIRALEALGTRRLTGTPTEKRAQASLGAEFEKLGFRLEWRPFRFPQSLYASLMLHFGLATIATAIGWPWPWLGAALHALAAFSYTLESTRRGLVLRSLFPSIDSQNLIAVKAAKVPMRRRLVLIAHADAAFTGLVFTPRLIKIATQQPPPGLGWFKKQLGLATATVAALVVLEALAALAALGAWSAPLWLRVVVTIPAAVTFLLNLDVVLRNHVVPGAADNLSGCSACVELAHRLERQIPDDVELVIVISGAEEAGSGGALRLAEEMERSREWTPSDTIVLGLDTLTNGALHYLEEGELWPIAVSPSLEAAIRDTNEQRPGQQPVTRFIVPTGATDALPFLVRGFPAVTLTCINPDIGAPTHYHRPTDTSSNIDVEQLTTNIDFAERLIVRLAKH